MEDGQHYDDMTVSGGRKNSQWVCSGIHGAHRSETKPQGNTDVQTIANKLSTSCERWYGIESTSAPKFGGRVETYQAMLMKSVH